MRTSRRNQGLNPEFIAPEEESSADEADRDDENVGDSDVQDIDDDELPAESETRQSIVSRDVNLDKSDSSEVSKSSDEIEISQPIGKES